MSAVFITAKTKHHVAKTKHPVKWQEYQHKLSRLKGIKL
jgi:hypothetical protein